MLTRLTARECRSRGSSRLRKRRELSRSFAFEPLEQRLLLATAPFSLPPEADGDVATVNLTGLGTVSPSDPDGNGIPQLDLAGTDASSSSLTVSVKKGPAGDGVVALDGILGTGLKTLNAKAVDIVGAGIDLAGLPAQKTAITLHVVGAGATLDVDSAISKLTVAAFGDGAVTAPSIGSLSVKGDKRLGTPADWRADINLSGVGVLPGKPALGSVKIAGTASDIAVNVTGDVKSFSAGRLVGSTIFVGYVPADPSAPLAGGAFEPGRKLGSFAAKGIKGSPAVAFESSVIAAANVGKVTLASTAADNGGNLFGVLGSESIAGVTSRSPAFAYRPGDPTPQGLTDFTVLRGPAAPQITGFATDSGVVGDSITSDTTLTVNGTAGAGRTVIVFFNGVEQGATVAAADGTWSFTAPAQPDGPHVIAARARDALGNTSPPSASLRVTIDSTAPGAPTITSFSNDTGSLGDGITRDTTLSITGTAQPGSTVSVLFNGTSLGTTTAAAGGGWLFNAPARADGGNSITATAQDAAGNTSGASSAVNVTIDTVAPTVTITSPAPNLTTNRNVAVTGTVTDIGPGVQTLEAQLDSGPLVPIAFGPGGSFNVSTSLPLDGSAEGDHQIRLRATDRAGNVSSFFDVFFTLDTVAPATPVFNLDPASDSPPVGDGQTTFPTVTLVGQTDPNVTVELVSSGLPPTMSNNSGRFQFSGVALAQGPNPFTVRARDVAGNQSSSQATISLFIGMPVAFADPDLADAVRTALGLPSGQIVTDVDMERLTELSLDSNRIDSLVGLEEADNLQSLTFMPSDWSVPGTLSDFTPLQDLMNLTSLALMGAGLDNAELTALAGLAVFSRLQSLDLRYNDITNLSPLAAHPTLAELKLYGNQPEPDLTPLKGMLVNVDLLPVGIDKADTIPELAAALHYLPIDIFEHVVNQFEYEPYAGAMKGPQAVLETGAGNDWDQASLLAELLGEAGVTTRYVTGQIEVPIETAMDYLGVTDPEAAGLVLANAGLNPISIIDAQDNVIAIEFDHAWLEADLVVPGSGMQPVAMDPSWKFKDFQPGVPGMLGLVPFNEAGYLSQTRKELTYEFYADQVMQYLAANVPGVSLADVAYDGPILPQSLDALPASLPYIVLAGTTTTTSTIPASMTHRVEVILQQGGGDLFQYILSMPEVGDQRVTISFADAGPGMVTPQLRLGGMVAASGPAIAAGSSVTLFVNHFDAGDDAPDQTTNYDRDADDYIAIGLDANQISDDVLIDQLRDINEAAVNQINGDPVDPEQQIGAFLSYAILRYFHDTDHAEDVIAGLTGGIRTLNRVASGLASAETLVQFFPDLMLPALPNGFNVDVANEFSQLFSIDGTTTQDAARDLILGHNSSAQEHAVWEEVANTESISTIKSLQLANERGIPILVVNSSNKDTVLPQLNLSASTKAQIEAAVDAGATVTVPRDETPLNDWQGVGYISRDADSEAYIISGGLSSSRTVRAGGSGTGDPLVVIVIIPDYQSTCAGDPVNIANGDVLHSDVDIELPGIGLPLSFRRNYRSGLDADIGFGPGWMHSYADFLTVQPGGSIVWTTSSCDPYTFTPDGAGGFITERPIFGTLTATAQGFTYRRKDGMSYDFNAQGKLVSMRDRNGNSITIAHDTNGRITLVMDADTPARRLTFTHDSAGHITAVSDFTGRTWTYEFDAAGQLIRATKPSDAQTPAAVTQYGYYTGTALGGLLRQITHPDGGTVEYSYYANRRAFEDTDPEGHTGSFHYNLFRNGTTFIDERGNRITYRFDGDGHVVQTTYPDGASESSEWQGGLAVARTDAFGKTERYQYDDQGNITRLVDRDGNVTDYSYEPVFSRVTSTMEPGGRLTRYDYDLNGNLFQVTDPLGHVTTMTYNSRGLLTSLTTPRGNETLAPGDFTATFTYNDAGQVLTRATDLPSLESFTYGARGNLVAQTDANSHTTTWEYDLRDNRIRMIAPLNQGWSLSYDAMDNLKAVTDPLNRTTRYEYDLRQRPVRTIHPDHTFMTRTHDAAGNQTTRADELGRGTCTVFDVRSRPVYTVFADGTFDRVSYDGASRVIARRDARGNLTQYAYDVLGRLVSSADALNQAITYTYDAVDNLLTVSDPLGHSTRYEYDLLNRRTKMIDPDLGATEYQYDANSNLISVTDPINNTTRFVYDVLDRMIGETDPLGATRSYSYDAVGNQVAVTDRNGRRREFTYDALDRLTVERWLDGAGDPVRTLTFTYDGANQLTAVVDAGSALTFSHDQRGRVTSASNAGTPNAPTVVLNYTYDAVGNIASMADTIGGESGGLIRYEYDTLNRTTRISQAGSGGNALRVDLTYNEIGQISTITRYADLAGTRQVAGTIYAYDDLNRLTDLTHSHGSTTVAFEHLTYDSASRITRIRDTDGTTDYTYDTRDELTSAAHSAADIPDESYSYDANGNRVASSRDGNGYQTGPGNRLLSDGTFNYEYDDEGNLIRRTEIVTGEVREFQWDHRNRLIAVIDKDASGNTVQRVEYTYDAFDRRIGKEVQHATDAVLTHFIYDRGNVLLDFVDNDGAAGPNPTFLDKRYLFGAAIDEILAQQDAGRNVLWHLSDHLGTIRDLANNNGDVVNHITYDSYGSVIDQASSIATSRFAFTGRELDAETGLYYYRARYYDAQMGRFLALDPMGLADGTNPYAYVRNDPVSRSDPTGLITLRQVFVVVVGAGAGAAVIFFSGGLAAPATLALTAKVIGAGAVAGTVTNVIAERVTVKNSCERNYLRAGGEGLLQGGGGAVLVALPYQVAASAGLVGTPQGQEVARRFAQDAIKAYDTGNRLLAEQLARRAGYDGYYQIEQFRDQLGRALQNQGK